MISNYHSTHDESWVLYYELIENEYLFLLYFWYTHWYIYIYKNCRKNFILLFCYCFCENYSLKNWSTSTKTFLKLIRNHINLSYTYSLYYERLIDMIYMTFIPNPLPCMSIEIHILPPPIDLINISRCFSNLWIFTFDCWCRSNIGSCCVSCWF